MQRRRGMEQTLIICSLYGLFWAADRDETCPTQQTGHCLPCRVGPISRVVSWANVPASLHGTVMPLDCEPIDARSGGGAGAREHLPVQGMQSPVRASSYSTEVSLGTRADPPFLTSEIYTYPFGKGSLLQLANTTVVLENGHGLSNTGHLLWG